ncbi:hypothetical protein ACJRO7_010538 [Eucalyptus globulus]|uniref:Glabrous enhancer-binding protein-like DBD domain-containing protein n=1 Tax=Eucalyptus globulus TaxID=34317 RepID=A0ABD3LCB8_EUCGL
MSSKRKVLVKEKLPAAKSDNEQKNNEESPSQPKPAPPRPQKSAPSLKKLKTVPSTSLKQVEVEKLGHAGEESKKLAFQKIWGDDDEITLLQGIIDYCEKGMDPFSNVSAFYHDVKGLLREDFTESQLANKVRVFKKKYRNNKGKGKVGEDRVFSNSHEGKIFELSKTIWGVEMRGNATSGREEIGVTIENKKTDGAGMFVAPPWSKSEASKSNDSQELLDDISHMCRIGLDEGSLNQGLALLEPSKRAELNERWSKLFCAEMQIVAERCAVIEDQLKLILEAYYHSTEK